VVLRSLFVSPAALQADNTPREMKNQIMAKLSSWLVTSGRCSLLKSLIVNIILSF
jgi:hypothetical protein